MSISNGYISADEFRAAYYPPDSTDTESDDRIGAVVNAASRAIDLYCNRRFYGASETRYYTAEDGEVLDVDDLTSVTTLATDDDGDRTYEYTWSASTDYLLYPYNAALDSKPYTRIEIDALNGQYAFPVGVQKGVKVIGVFGYIASTDATNAPPEIKQACTIQAGRLFERHNAPFGVMGAGEFGQATVVPKLDPDVQALLAPFRRMSIGAV